MGAFRSTSSTLFGLATLAMLVGCWPVLAHGESADAANAQAGSAAQASPLGQTLARLHHENVIEIREGQLARVKGTSEEIRSYGKMLVEDHGKADKKLMALAAQKNLDIATPPREKGTPPARDQQVNRLDGLKGQAFDKAFAEATLRDHQHAVKMTKQLEKKTQDDQVRAFVNDLLSMQEKHLQKAHDIEAKVAGGGKNAKPNAS